MKTINRSTQPYPSGRKLRFSAVLVSLVILISAYAPPLAINPTDSIQASPLLVTPTPTPTPAPVASEDASSDLQALTAEIQNLAAIIEALQVEIQNLKGEIQNLQSQISNPPPPISNPTVAILEELSGQPCPDSDFTCVTLTVPLDHFDAANRETIDVVFGILPATGERKGMLVTANGGPGYSGVFYADSYTSIDPRLAEHFDLVHFDLRGLASSGGFQCAEAAVPFYQANWGGRTPAEEAEFLEIARTFAEDCVKEMGVLPEKLRYYSTRQAVEDLELFRQAVGDDKFWLYGLSYGTQFGQTYAATHPDHLAGLIIDGVVDLTLSGAEYWAGVTQKHNDLLVATLEACNADATCSADMGGDALTFYDNLAAKLATEPASFTFPLPSGGSEERLFTLSNLDTAASGYLYPADARLLFQRALAYAARDDNLVPLIQLVYSPLGIDPETLEAIPDPTYSDAVYYTVTCNDYTYRVGTPEESAAAFLHAGDIIDTTVPRLTSIFYSDMPCVFWPEGEDNTVRPAPLVAEGIPTLVIGATGDPITPVEYGQQVYSHLADGYLITVEGGGHVMFGGGNTCVDEVIVDFLIEDKLPQQKEITCEDIFVDNYVPLAPADAKEFANPLEALLSADTEINYLPEYYYWDVETPTSVGCPHGGTLAFEAGDEGDEFTLTDCAFSAGFTMSGAGLNSYNDASFTLTVEVAGPAGVAGSLVYQRDENGANVTGEYAGEKIDLVEEG